MSVRVRVHMSLCMRVLLIVRVRLHALTLSVEQVMREAYMYGCMYESLFVYIDLYTYASTYTHIQMYVCLYIYLVTHTHTYICTYTYKNHIYLYICM